MVKILYLDYVSVIVYLLMGITLWRRKAYTGKANRCFTFVVVISLYTTLYDICSVALDNNGEGAVMLKYAMHCGYLVLRNMIAPLFTCYVISVADTWHIVRKKKFIRLISYTPFIIIAVMTLLSPYTHLVFYLNEHTMYTRGPMFFILYISAGYYLLAYVYVAVRQYRALGFSRFVPLITTFPLQLLAIGIQFVHPNLLCEMMATSVCLLFIMLTIMRPDALIDTTTGLRKQNIFNDVVKLDTYVKKPFTVIITTSVNHDALVSYLPFMSVRRLTKQFADRIQNVITNNKAEAEIYNLEDGVFAATLYEEDMNKKDTIAGELLGFLNKDFELDNASVSIPVNVCIVNLPEDFDNINSLSLLLKDLKTAKYTGSIMYAKDLLAKKDYELLANMDAILKKAIENDEFDVYYQPIYSVKEKKFNSAEALIRLKTEEHGFIRPDLFIPIAEESGLINEIGMIVYKKVCDFISSEKFKELGLDYIEINLSVIQCMNKNLANELISVLDELKISPTQINLEITETASTASQKSISTNVDTLFNKGISFSLDDFGTGYSSIMRISSLPVHIVKLDKSFTWTNNNPKLKIILENTIKMLKLMKLKIVVEGIETKEMLETFTALGCDYIQGYFFSKPLPEDDFVGFIRKNL